MVFWITLLLLAVALFVSLCTLGRGYWAWISTLALLLVGWGVRHQPDLIVLLQIAGVLALVAVLMGLPPLRRQLVTRPLRRLVAPLLPVMSETERVALEGGTVWWDGELFSGDPNWDRLFDFQLKGLTAEEQAFLDGPVERVCALTDDWEIYQKGEVTEEIWDVLKKEKFLGLIIPKEYGGLGFGAAAHSDIVTRLASRSAPVAVSVMVPNSLGPAELLVHYGTEEQKQLWLPRLAAGKEIPCFALTGPENGSDAAAMGAEGIVCRGKWKRREVIGISLTWDKRYTTLGPMATLLGLAFRLKDPECLLSEEIDRGITLALVPTNLKGIEIGDRHDPCGVPFSNGPNKGKDVFIPLDAIIGGAEMAGKGWRMLMDCLAAGRSISLPSQATGGGQLATRAVGAYASLRRQFGLPIGKFEGVAERMARIGGLTYTMQAARTLTAAAVDAGEQPSVISAIVKAYLTEAARQVANDGMDVMAGAGVSRGPHNPFVRMWQATPIGITVEGANILTRSMIIYGQGALRCHPFAQAEMDAVASGDLTAFDRAFFGHINFVFTNMGRALLSGFTGRAPPKIVVGKDVTADLGALSRLSAAFAFTSDVCMGTLGGELKRREMLSGRLADVLAWMYLGSAVVKRYVADGESETDRPAARWAIDHALYQAEQALLGVAENHPSRGISFLLRRLVFPRGPRYRPPTDETARALAEGLLDDRGLRRSLTRDVYQPPPEDLGLGRLERALKVVLAGAGPERKLNAARHSGDVPSEGGREEQITAALEAGVLDESEAERVKAADAARMEAIKVDAFSPKEWKSLRG